MHEISGYVLTKDGEEYARLMTAGKEGDARLFLRKVIESNPLWADIIFFLKATRGPRDPLDLVLDIERKLGKKWAPGMRNRLRASYVSILSHVGLIQKEGSKIISLAEAAPEELLRNVLDNLLEPKHGIERVPSIVQPPAEEQRRFPLVHFNITQAVQNNPMIKRRLPNVGFNIRNSSDSPVRAKVKARVFLGSRDLGLVEGSQRGGKYMGYYDGKILWNLNPYTIFFGNFSVPKICAETDENLRIEVSVTLIDIDGQEHKLLPVSWTFMRDKNDWFLEPAGDC